MMVITAWFNGLWRLLLSAWLIPLVYLLTLAVTLPLAAKLHYDLPEPAQPFATEPGAGPIPDFDWLDEVTANKRSLLGELLPTVIGVAAPLENLDELLDARPARFALLLSGLMLVVWSYLWGGVITRMGRRPRRFFTACQQSFSDVLAVNIGGLVIAVIVYAVARLVLLGGVSMLFGDGTAESTILVARAAATIVMVMAVTAVVLVTDYARIAVVLDDISIRTALGRGLHMVKTRTFSVFVLVALSALAFAGLLAVYAAFEFIPGGSVPTLTRIIVLGQAYIVARVALRLWNAGAQVALYDASVAQPRGGAVQA